MNDLHINSCEPCHSDVPPASVAKIEQFRQQLPGWDLLEIEGIFRLVRQFKFKTFSQALAFTNRVGEIAEAEQHHPAILTEWGSVTVSWWTHKIGGLHRNDFIMAAKTDQLLAESPSS
jgi:4a-hydroxytetrahydrobiopterin dehydratase